MKIMDVGAKEIPACCTFKLRGFEISCSTIAQPKEVMVFDEKDIAVERFDTVEEAIKFVLFRD